VSVDLYPATSEPARPRMNRAQAAAWGVTIGQLCSLFNLTPRAIRFYEERGLVTATRDRQNRRIFDLHARQRLHVIADLRRAGLSLNDIRDALDDADGDEALLKQQVLAQLAARLQALDETRKALVSTIEHFALEAPDSRVTRLPRR